MVCKCFDIKSPDRAVKSKTMSSHKIAKELHKSVIRKFEKLNVTHLLKIIFGLLILRTYN